MYWGSGGKAPCIIGPQGQQRRGPRGENEPKSNPPKMGVGFGAIFPMVGAS